jgi:hypothetical protein
MFKDHRLAKYLDPGGKSFRNIYCDLVAETEWLYFWRECTGFICGLLNNPVSSLDQRLTIKEQLIGRDLERSGYDVIQGNILKFVWRE